MDLIEKYLGEMRFPKDEKEKKAFKKAYKDQEDEERRLAPYLYPQADGPGRWVVEPGTWEGKKLKKGGQIKVTKNSKYFKKGDILVTKDSAKVWDGKYK